MNPKFLKKLKVCCERRNQSFKGWKRAYKLMPRAVQEEFRAKIIEEAQLIKNEALQKSKLDKAFAITQ